jgi:putative phage-type endonuclease
MTQVNSSFTKPESWHKERATGIGGSEIAAILGISPYTTAYQLWLDKTGKTPRKDISNLPHVQRGILGEEVCRDLYERTHLKSFKPKMWQGKKSWHRASDDGWNIDDNVTMEIKCMSALNHEMTKNGIVPPHYMCQMQWVLFVSKATKCLFISYRPEDETMHVVDVFPDPKEQKKIEEAVDYFWTVNVQQDIPPALTDRDFVKVADRTLDEKLKRYEEIKKQITALEGEEESLKEAVRPYISGHPAIITPQGFRISIGSRQGSVDYKQLCKDKGIGEDELTKYKKKPVPVFTIRLP